VVNHQFLNKKSMLQVKKLHPNLKKITSFRQLLKKKAKTKQVII